MKTRLFTLAGLMLMMQTGHGQINLNKVKNKVETSVGNSGSNNNNSGTGTNTGGDSQKTTSGENQAVTEAAPYYEAKGKFMDQNMNNIATRQWDENFMGLLRELDLPALEARMSKDLPSLGDYLMLYPKKLPTSGMGTITQQNLGDYSFARIADANAEPPAGENGKKILDFYKEYCLCKQQFVAGKSSIAENIRGSIQQAESAHIRQRYTLAKSAREQAELAYLMIPGDERISDLKDEANRVYNSVIEGFGKMITGEFHKNHLQEIKIFKVQPAFGSETEEQLIETIIPGEAAYVTGYFAMTNKDAGGIPSLLFISPEDQYAKDQNPWGHGNEIIASMFDGQNVRDEFYDKACFTFNLFPDLNTVNYKSHVQYIPHLNILKWLMYLPSESLDIPVRFGRSEVVALGRIKIDLSGANKEKLKTYYNALLEKQKAAVTFPDLAGCEDAKGKIRNYDELSKYGKVLRITLQKTGDIMKPWPNDHEIEYNTAQGYAAVEKADGKVEVMALEFRKTPGETTWQWWSVGSFPNLYPMNDNGSEITGVKKLEHGYEILPQNVSSCGYWYTPR